MKLPAVLEKYKSEIQSELESVFAERPSPLGTMMTYHLGLTDAEGNPGGSSGKALRPTLCLLACEATGGEYHRALPVAAALELVHNYSLIHDDIQDNDAERRHQPTVWKIWGMPQAINAGTAMRMYADRALLHLERHGIAPEAQLRIQRCISETNLRLLEGQYYDIDFEQHCDITVSDYEEMIDGKTATLIACCLETGAILGSDNAKIIGKFRSIGRNIGLAFQIQDDILGIWGKAEELGKPIGSDIRRKKKSYPLIYAFEYADKADREQLVALYEGTEMTDESVATVLSILEHCKAQQKAQEAVTTYHQAASHLLETMSLQPAALNDLRELFLFLTTRTF